MGKEKNIVGKTIKSITECCLREITLSKYLTINTSFKFFLVEARNKDFKKRVKGKERTIFAWAST